MSKMKESASRMATMQSASVTSGPGQRVLTRSRSLASPMMDVNLSLPSGINGATSQGSLSTASKVKAGGSSAALASSGETGKGPKKTLRRQKSLAELFGVVIYKSKVQLQELFSRKDREASRDAGRNASLASAKVKTSSGASEAEPETGVGAGIGGCAAQLEKAAAASGIAAAASFAASPGKKVGRQKQQLVPQGSFFIGRSDPDLSISGRTVNRPQSRTPEELFCVTRLQPGETERPASTRSLDTLQHQHSPSSTTSEDVNWRDLGRGSPGNGGRFLKPEWGFKAKASLVKSNSDSLCRMTLAPSGEASATLIKASSDDACFVRRSPSPLLPRDDSNNPSPVYRSGISNASPRPNDRFGLSPVSAVLDWLLVGGVEAAYNEPLLCSLGVDAIVDITNISPQHVPSEKKTICPCTCRKKHFRSKLNLAVDDIEWENIEQHFPDVNAFLNGWRQRGSRVLVVSYHGRSRAPAVAVQYLMHHFRIPLERALAHMKSRRLQTRINPGFLRALQRLEKRQAQQDSSTLSSPPPEFPECAPPSPKTAWDEC